MNKFLNRFNTPHKEGWQDLMKDQLYTAVLGSIIYLVFEWGYALFENGYIWENIDWGLRTLLLILCVIFYICDYYYIKYSNPYRKWHFALDFAFMASMFFAVKSLNLSFIADKCCTIDGKQFLKEINLLDVSLPFLIFFGLYLFWDYIEMLLSRRENPDQTKYYLEIILWEVVSIIGFGLNMFLGSATILVITLSISTYWFVSIAKRKKDHKSNVIGNILGKTLSFLEKLFK